MGIVRKALALLGMIKEIEEVPVTVQVIISVIYYTEMMEQLLSFRAITLIWKSCSCKDVYLLIPEHCGTGIPTVGQPEGKFCWSGSTCYHAATFCVVAVLSELHVASCAEGGSTGWGKSGWSGSFCKNMHLRCLITLVSQLWVAM